MNKKESTDDRILKSAQEIFHEKGFAGARMQEIADNANINKGLLHYYYKSKNKLFEKVFSIAIKFMLEKLNVILSSDTPLFEKIILVVDYYITTISNNAFIPVFILQELNRNPEFFEKKIKHLANLDGIEFFRKQVKSETEKNNIIEINADQLILNIISMSIFPIIAKPMAMGILNIQNKEYQKIIEERKKLVAEFTINSIKKQIS